jgi:acyl CoA:acetate/3-ketoacid CoA transferase alpha subunit
MTDKRMPLDDAIDRFVRPGMALHLAYGGGRPNAAVAAIVRRFAGTDPRFTVSAQGFVNSQVALLDQGLVERLVVAFAGENFPSPRPNPAVQRAVAPEGGVALENWTIWTLTARLMAGALGVPFLPVRSIVGSGMEAEHAGRSFATVSALGSDAVGVVAALRPDIVLVHGLVADREGNVILAAPYGERAWGALASTVGVIATVERIVDDEVIRAHNALPMIPAAAVLSVTEAPMGSHPYGLSNAGVPEVDGYAEDAAFMAELRHAARDPERLAAWTADWMLGPRDHDALLEKLGAERIAALRGTAPVVVPTRGVDDPPTADERMTLVATRLLRDRVRATGCDVVLAGIGYAHLAAWTAVTTLQAEGASTQLAAELGMSGFRPRAGDPYLFARQNLPTSAQLTDVIDVLARDVSGPALRSIGILGAGQVDREGGLNSTFSADGRFILGSGGANDVASGADEVIVVLRHSADRLVTAVDYVTAPGTRVTAIVTSEAVLERRAGGFVVTRYLADVDREDALASIRAGVGWDVEIDPAAEHEPEPSPDDLALLRSFDPAGVFLG